MSESYGPTNPLRLARDPPLVVAHKLWIIKWLPHGCGSPLNCRHRWTWCIWESRGNVSTSERNQVESSSVSTASLPKGSRSGCYRIGRLETASFASRLSPKFMSAIATTCLNGPSLVPLVVSPCRPVAKGPTPHRPETLIRLQEPIEPRQKIPGHSGTLPPKK